MIFFSIEIAMEKDFDNKLRDILNAPPAFEPSASDLDLMRSKLGAEKRSYPWLLPLLFLPFFLGGYCIYEKVEDLSNTVAVLEAKNQSLQGGARAPEFLEDSLIHKTVYIYDTIYRKFYQDVYVQKPQKKVSRQETLLEKKQNFEDISISEWQQMALVLERFALERGWLVQGKDGDFVYKTSEMVPNQGSSISLWSKKEVNDSAEHSEYFSINQRPFTAFPPVRTKSYEAFPNKIYSWKFAQSTIKQNPILEQKKSNPLLYLVPRGLSVGLEGSPLGASRIVGSTKNYSYEYGLSTAIHFAKNVRLESGAFVTTSKIYTKNAALYSQLPPGNPIEPTQTIKEIKGTLSYLRVPLVLSKTFNVNNNRFKPSVSFGLIAQRPLQQNLKYEFINAAGDEYYSPQKYYSGKFSFANPYLALGLVKNIDARYRFHVKGFYQWNSPKDVNAYVPKGYFGIRLGIERHL